MVYRKAVVTFVSLFFAALPDFAATHSTGATRIAKWKDDKKAAFMLMFDDSIPTHVNNVFPELKARGMIATFYVNPGSYVWQSEKTKWEKELPQAGMVYGNHTFTHRGARDSAKFEEEFGKCTDAIAAAYPHLKKPFLISFGVPGVPAEDWQIGEDQFQKLLQKN